MSRIHPNGLPSWLSQTGVQSKSENMDARRLERPTDGDSSGEMNVWDRNAWSVRRLEELNHNKNWHEQWNPRMSMSFDNTKGLLNAPGDNNCFLNSAVQVLWHLDVFRRSFRMLSGHSCLGGNSCIFCALKVIFTQFQYSDQSCLPPDSLRKALAKTFADQQRFQLGLMDDAAECFENILTQIHFHIANGESEDMCNAKHCISHQKFAMTIIEQVVCQCQATSEPLPFSQMVHYVSTSTLVSQAQVAKGAATFGQLLKGAISEGDYRNCPSNCGRKVQLRRTLLNSPDVVTVGLVWDSENPSSEHIHDVVWNIGTTLQLRDLFHHVVDVRCSEGSKLYLVGVVCYYGKHYSTFFYHSKMKTWVSFDDANVREMGSDWSAVVEKCCRGHYQPLLLLYANPDAEVISVKTAPQKTVIVKETAFLSNSDETGSGPTGSYHCRQRSCDSLSGTIGGQCVDDTYGENIKPKRSVTPSPDMGKEKIELMPRRAVTPGPGWGHFEVDKNCYDPVSHQRQSSYLSALDSMEQSQVQRAPPVSGQNAINGIHDQEGHSGSHVIGKTSVGNPSVPHHQEGTLYQEPFGYQNGHYARARPQYVSESQSCSTIAYGSVCSESTVTSVAHSSTAYQVSSSHSAVNSCYINGQQSAQTLYPAHHGNSVQTAPASHSARFSDSVQPISASHGAHSHNSRQAVPASHSADFSNSAQMALASQGAHFNNSAQSVPASHSAHFNNSAHYVPASHSAHFNNSTHPVPVSHTSHYTNSQQLVPTSYSAYSASSRQHLPTPSCNVPSMPGMKRAQSMEIAESLSSSSPSHSLIPRPTMSRSRPSSARPYDYGNSQALVEPKTCPVIMSTHQQQTLPLIGSGSVGCNDGILIGDFTTPDSCVPKQVTQGDKRVPSCRWNDEEDSYDTYINPKTVQNVLNIQKNRQVKCSRVGLTVSNSSTESCDKKEHGTWQHEDILMPNLKVDIPGDDISLGSHKDSGYRSGGSTGDRNSASSASSTSFDSPDNFRAFVAPSLPLGHHAYNSSHSSSESLSSTHSGQTIRNGQHNRLSLIQENVPSLSSSSKGSKIQDDICSARDDVDGYVTHRSSSTSGVWQSNRQHQRNRLNSVETSPKYQPDAECQKVYLEAEAMLGMSTKQEEHQDLPSALAYCSQAVNHLQMALSVPGISNDMSVHVRMKHNACALRSRKLRKQIDQQKKLSEPSVSNHTAESKVTSSLKNEKQRTLCVKSLKPGIEKTSFERPVRKEYVSEKKHYQPSSQEQCGNHGINYSRTTSSSYAVCALPVSGMAQSRPVNGVTMGHADVPILSPDVASHHSGDVPKGSPAQPKDIMKHETLDSKETRHIEIYGTLPKRKGRGSKSPQQAEHCKLNQSESEKQSSLTTSEGKNTNPKSLGRQCQWSKNDFHEMIRSDFMNHPRTSSIQTGQRTTIQCRSSDDPPESVSPEISGRSHNFNSKAVPQKLKEPITTTEQCPELPPKQKYVMQKSSYVNDMEKYVQEESHYDYLPLYKKQNQLATSSRHSGRPSDRSSGHPSERSSAPISGVSCGSGVTIVGITGIPNHKPASSSTRVSHSQANEDPEVKLTFQDPYSSKRELPTIPSHSSLDGADEDQKRFYPKPSVVKKMDRFKTGNNINTFGEQSQQDNFAAARTVPIKVNKPDTPPKPSHKPSKLTKPDVPKRKHSQLTTFKGDTPASFNCLHNSEPANTIQSDRSLSGPPPYIPPPPAHALDCELPPPPAELLYPPPPDEGPVSSTAPSTPSDCDMRGNRQCSCDEAAQGMMAPTVQHVTPGKPVLAKLSKAQKARKCVTFSENIALIATPEEVPQEIDYVAYVMNLGKNKSIKKNGDAAEMTRNNDRGDEDEDDDDNTSDSMDSDAVLCNLCRKKKIHPPEVYCEHCCFYMSQFQPQAN